MCTLIALWKCHPAGDLILALNRDEYAERPTQDYAVWAPEDAGKIVSGRDLRSGGTWFAMGRQTIAALTNHRSGAPSVAGAKSRGALVVAAALSGSVARAKRALEGETGPDYGGFHLLAADNKDMAWLTNRDGALIWRAVEPGLHVLGNYGLDNEDDPVVTNVRQRMAGWERWEAGELRTQLEQTLAMHGEAQPCVHRGPYGTQSAAIFMRTQTGPRLQTTLGPSCENSWRDMTHLLEDLRG